MAAKPITLSRSRQIVITHVTRIDSTGGRGLRITHDQPQIRLVKLNSADHNAAESPAMTLTEPSGESAIETA